MGKFIEVDKMIFDPRPIACIWSEHRTFRVGEGHVTKIVVYQEYGHMNAINYAAIYCDGVLKHRVDLTGWGITYEC